MGSTGGLGAVGPEVRLLSSPPVIPVVLSLKTDRAMAMLTYADFDDDAVLTMRLANQAAWKLNHYYIDTEHILIGLCHNCRSLASGCLAHFNVTTDQLAAEIERRVKRGLEPVAAGKRPARRQAKRVTEEATQIASNLDAPSVGTIHLLLAMLTVDDTIAADVLKSLGLRYDNVWAYIAKRA